MTNMTVKEIGKISTNEGKMQLQIDEPYRQGLVSLKDFSHLIILYWANQADEAAFRDFVLCDQQIYQYGPTQMGVFATRSAYRPNPILSSTVEPLRIDSEQGLIDLAYIDAFNDTPLLDIKPYTPSIDRVDTYRSPDWCQHWPQNVESSGNFPWETEFLF